MKRKILIITIIIITIIVLLLLPPLLINLFESGTKIDWNMHMDSYKDYYIYRIDYEKHGVFETSAYTRLWFKPSQKEQLLNKIKEDVNEILTDIQMQAGKENVTIDYEISDDFKSVTLYIDSYETYMQMRQNNEFNELDVIDASYLEMEIGLRVTLYHELILGTGGPYYGHIDIPYFGTVVNLVYNGSEAGMKNWFEEQEQEQEKEYWYLLPNYDYNS